MSSLARIAVHRSQFPEQVRRDLLASLHMRKVNHKFHYDSLKQTQRWLALHQTCSPSRTDPDCAAAYDRSFEVAAARIRAKSVHVIGLGCGGGQKDARLLKLLRQAGKEVFYTPSDVSAAMVLVARQAAAAVLPEVNCFPFVCDLASAADLPSVLDLISLQLRSAPRSRQRVTRRSTLKAARLITFFGMIPNFEPQVILPRLAALVGASDFLLFSANLAPGPDYSAGVRRVLPLYDNRLTRDWLMTFLLDLGVERADGRLRFVIEDTRAGSGLKRIAAYFHFARRRILQVDEQRFEFRRGDAVRLFFSYRHTPALVMALLRRHGLQVLDQWLANSGEEGVFLVARGDAV